MDVSSPASAAGGGKRVKKEGEPSFDTEKSISGRASKGRRSTLGKRKRW